MTDGTHEVEEEKVSKVRPLLSKTKTQIAAEMKHREKTVAYQRKKVRDMQAKLALGTMQLLYGMKQAPWCVRWSICWEIFWRRTNPNYDEYGEWIGKEEDRNKKPWCVQIREIFRKKVASTISREEVLEAKVDLKKESKDG